MGAGEVRNTLRDGNVRNTYAVQAHTQPTLTFMSVRQEKARERERKRER